MIVPAGWRNLADRINNLTHYISRVPQMSASEDTDYKMFAIVLGALVFFTFFIIVIANKVSPSMAGSDPLVAAQLKERVMPIGQSRVSP